MAATHGLYVQKTASGAIFGVQVEDGAGNSWSITASEYAIREYRPPLAELPDIGAYHAAQFREGKAA